MESWTILLCIRHVENGRFVAFQSSTSDACLRKLLSPTAVREDGVRFGSTDPYQFIADFLRKGNVHEAVAVNVADFSSAQVVLFTSKAMRLGGDSRPTLQRSIDSFFCPRNRFIG
jgi:hypothetical protein